MITSKPAPNTKYTTTGTSATTNLDACGKKFSLSIFQASARFCLKLCLYVTVTEHKINKYNANKNKTMPSTMLSAMDQPLPKADCVHHIKLTNPYTDADKIAVHPKA